MKNKKQRVEVVDKSGTVLGAFSFNPTDRGIMRRYLIFKLEMAEIVEIIKGLGINADGTVKDPADFEALCNAEKRLYDILDYLFDCDFSSAVFGSVRPFAAVAGYFYCQSVINNTWSYAESCIASQGKKSNAAKKKNLFQQLLKHNYKN